MVRSHNRESRHGAQRVARLPHRLARRSEAGAELAKLHIELERNVQAPAIARAAAAGVCSREGVDEPTFLTVVLLVSEVVTNAVLHSTAPQEDPIACRIAVSEHAVRVSVLDRGHGFTPTPRDRTPGGDGGYGLYLLETNATRWGVTPLGGTCVWFEVALPVAQ